MHESLASYAKQAADDTLRKHADRIQARTVRRCGKNLPDEIIVALLQARGAMVATGYTARDALRICYGLFLGGS